MWQPHRGACWTAQDPIQAGRYILYRETCGLIQHQRGSIGPQDPKLAGHHKSVTPLLPPPVAQQTSLITASMENSNASVPLRACWEYSYSCMPL